MVSLCPQVQLNQELSKVFLHAAQGSVLLSLHLSSQSLCFSLFLFNAFSPNVSSRFVRLEGLSGLSVQDAELKLLADEKPESSSAAKAGKPAGSRVSTEGEGGVGEDDARPGGAEAAAVTAGNGESAGGGNKKKKRKRGKKQAAVTQRGPLLITHTGAV